jgi:hypothetical protein
MGYYVPLAGYSISRFYADGMDFQNHASYRCSVPLGLGGGPIYLTIIVRMIAEDCQKESP